MRNEAAERDAAERKAAEAREQARRRNEEEAEREQAAAQQREEERRQDDARRTAQAEPQRWQGGVDTEAEAERIQLEEPERIRLDRAQDAQRGLGVNVSEEERRKVREEQEAARRAYEEAREKAAEEQARRRQERLEAAREKASRLAPLPSSESATPLSPEEKDRMREQRRRDAKQRERANLRSAAITSARRTTISDVFNAGEELTFDTKPFSPYSTAPDVAVAAALFYFVPLRCLPLLLCSSSVTYTAATLHFSAHWCPCRAHVAHPTDVWER